MRAGWVTGGWAPAWLWGFLGGKHGEHESVQLVVFVLEGSETLLWMKDASCDAADTFVFLSCRLFETKLDKRSCCFWAGSRKQQVHIREEEMFKNKTPLLPHKGSCC